MFFLSLIEHTLRLPPHLLDLSLDKTIQGELESQFLDKVIADLGLCISVYDIRSIDGDFVFPADGASTYTGFQLYHISPDKMKTESMVFQLMYLDDNDMYQSLALVPDLGNAVQSCRPFIFI